MDRASPPADAGADSRCMMGESEEKSAFTYGGQLKLAPGNVLLEHGENKSER